MNAIRRIDDSSLYHAEFDHSLFFSNMKSASSLPGKDGSGICSTFSQSGISRAIQSAMVSLAKAVKPLAF